MARCRARVAALGFIFICALPAGAVILADSVSVSGDSISRAFDANTASCTYSDQVSRNWATGDDHGSSFCSAGGDGTFSHAERLECNKGGDVTIFNDAMSGGGLGSGLQCDAVWALGGICSSLTADCSNQRRIDMYNTLVGYNEILERVTNEYAALSPGGCNPPKASDVQIRFENGTFYYK